MNFFKAVKIGIQIMKKIEQVAKDGKIDSIEMIEVIETICNIMEVEVE